MEITRKIEVTMAENSTYIIRKTSPGKPPSCAKCGEPTLTAQQAAGMFAIVPRRIFQIIEMGAPHLAEAGAVMICIKSLERCLGADDRK